MFPMSLTLAMSSTFYLLVSFFAFIDYIQSKPHVYHYLVIPGSACAVLTIVMVWKWYIRKAKASAR